MDRKTFERFRSIVYEKSGIALGEKKEALVQARVAKRMRTLGMAQDREYLRYLEGDSTGEEIVQFLNVITTNVTSFFREAEHFDFFRDIVCDWVAKGQKRFRFWSAASSTGEEPYSIAITLLESTRHETLDMKILATDISTRVLSLCQAGEYAKDKLKTVSPRQRERYFTACRNNGETTYRAKPLLKSMVLFRRLNLSTPPFPMKGPLDIVFCRNVMIYFDDRVRRGLLSEVYRLLKPGGHLIVGHAESLTGMVSSFVSVKPSIYVKR